MARLYRLKNQFGSALLARHYSRHQKLSRQSPRSDVPTSTPHEYNNPLTHLERYIRLTHPVAVYYSQLFQQQVFGRKIPIRYNFGLIFARISDATQHRCYSSHNLSAAFQKYVSRIFALIYIRMGWEGGTGGRVSQLLQNYNRS